MPTTDEFTWKQWLAAAGLVPAYVRQTIGMEKFCIDRINIVKESLLNYGFAYTIYCITACYLYGIVFEHNIKRSRFMKIIIPWWRGSFGVGNPITGISMAAVNALETLVDGVIGAFQVCDYVYDKTLGRTSQLASPVQSPFAPVQSPFAPVQSPFTPAQPAKSPFEKLGGKFTKRKNKLRKTKKY